MAAPFGHSVELDAVRELHGLPLEELTVLAGALLLSSVLVSMRSKFRWSDEVLKFDGEIPWREPVT